MVYCQGKKKVSNVVKTIGQRDVVASAVRASPHGVMGRRIGLSWWTH